MNLLHGWSIQLITKFHIKKKNSMSVKQSSRISITIVNVGNKFLDIGQTK